MNDLTCVAGQHKEAVCLSLLIHFKILIFNTVNAELGLQLYKLLSHLNLSFKANVQYFGKHAYLPLSYLSNRYGATASSTLS